VCKKLCKNKNFGEIYKVTQGKKACSELAFLAKHKFLCLLVAGLCFIRTWYFPFSAFANQAVVHAAFSASVARLI
jgi:hypothetical protein